MKIVFTPDWFLGHDVLIEIFSFVVLFVFFILCLRYYKLNKKKNVLYLGIGFLLIAIAQVAVILTKLVLYYDMSFTQNIGRMIVTYNVVKTIDIFYYLGFFIHRLLSLLGFYIIYRLPLQKKSRGDFILVIYFMVFLTSLSLLLNYFSQDLNLITYYFFHLTILFILAFIIRNYYLLYRKNKLTNTCILLTAFSVLALGHAMFILCRTEIIVVLANILELISYLILLFLIIRIVKHGKKKKPYGYNLRHVGNNPRKKRKD